MSLIKLVLCSQETLAGPFLLVNIETRGGDAGGGQTIAKLNNKILTQINFTQKAVCFTPLTRSRHSDVRRTYCLVSNL